MPLLWRHSCGHFRVAEDICTTYLLFAIIMPSFILDHAVMITEIRLRVAGCASSSRMFKDALRSEVELELATVRDKIMFIRREIDSCERAVLWNNGRLLIIRWNNSGRARPSTREEQ